MSAAALQAAIDRNDLATVQALMTADPTLHRAPLGYGEDGPLTWAAECRVPREAPKPERLAMVEWMVRHGSDIHQGGDGPLMRAALDPERIPMMDLLVRLGADVNAKWHGNFPMLYAACEAMNPASLRWLLERGADPNCTPAPALDYLLEAYVRRPPVLTECIDILRGFGARSTVTCPALWAVLRGDTVELALALAADPPALHRRFPDSYTFSPTAGRRLSLAGATLLHAAAEFQQLEAARFLLQHGADVNALALPGQTALFHAATQWDDGGLPIVELLLAHGADAALAARVPGDYEKPGEFLHCTAVEYARRFPGDCDGVASLLARVGPGRP